MTIHCFTLRYSIGYYTSLRHATLYCNLVYGTLHIGQLNNATTVTTLALPYIALTLHYTVRRNTSL